MTQDTMTTIQLELDMETWGVLALQAHDLDIKLNDHLVSILMQVVADTDGIELTPTDWLRYDKTFKGIIVLDPDGRVKTNFDKDWSDEITRDAMVNKLSESPTIGG